MNRQPPPLHVVSPSTGAEAYATMTRAQKRAWHREALNALDREAFTEMREAATRFIDLAKEIAGAETLPIGAREEARQLAEHLADRMRNLEILGSRQ